MLLAGVGYQGDDSTSFTIVLDAVLTGVEYQGDDSTSFTTVFDAFSKEKTPPDSETSFFCIPRTRGSGRPSLAGACFSQHLPAKLPSSTF